MEPQRIKKAKEQYNWDSSGWLKFLFRFWGSVIYCDYNPSFMIIKFSPNNQNTTNNFKDQHRIILINDITLSGKSQ